MEKKAKRRTRERILEASLRLFNDFGEPNVTTTVIADDLNISPGNLYYHFHSKDEIVNELFTGFEREINGTLAAPTRRAANVEDMWLFLHVLFEEIWKYRFLYRDLDDLLSRKQAAGGAFQADPRAQGEDGNRFVRRARGDRRDEGQFHRDPGAGDQHGGHRHLLAAVRVCARSAPARPEQRPRSGRISGDVDDGALPAGCFAPVAAAAFE
ncbi:MAG: TetR/AcrR family transcriptional regulator [Rhodocyclaceae bacterium]|nr:TetR/AcrR family transcriptional regulator [Rhodocyclaceae bacterium]